MKKHLLITSLVLLTFSINVMAQITNGLIGYFPFTGNANDLSGNSNNGIVSGATLTTDRFGNTNSAYDFSGTDDYIEVSTANGMFNSQTYTYSFWTVNSAMSTSPAFISRLSTSSGTSNVYDNFVFFASAGKANLNYQSTNGNMLSSANDGNGPNMLGNVWQHIVITVAPDSIRSYLNGVLVKKEAFLFGINFNNSYAIRFGRSTHTFWDDFSGILDDIRIYNRAVAPSEVIDLYNGTSTGFNTVTIENTIKIWPNPANDRITIDYGNIVNLTGYQLKITNSLGQQVFQSAVNQQRFNIDLSSWTGNGLYLIHIIDSIGNTVDVRKIVLQ